MSFKSAGKDLEALINSFIVEEDSAAQETFGKNLVESFSLLQIVKGLEDPLTQDDSLVRAKATQCLANVVEYNDELNKQEIEVLSVFLRERLHDQDSVAPAAKGLRALTFKKSYSYPKDDDLQFWNKLRDVDMIHLDAGAKYEVYLLLERLANSLSISFLDTFVALAGGEKDPRNLMLNLEISSRLLEILGSQLPQEKRSEIYDITFCYFPVKFHPPKDMPYQITGAEIREALQKTLSSPALAQFAIPGFISKLTAVNIEVKKDSLNGLMDSLNKLKNTEGLDEYWHTVWEGIKYEVLHGTPENETYAPSIKILSNFVNIPKFLETVLEEFEGESIPKTKLIQLCHLVVGISTSETVWNKLAFKAVEKSLSNLDALNILLSAPHPVPEADQIMQALLAELANGQKRDSIHGLLKLAQNKNGLEYVPLIIQTMTQESAYVSLKELAGLHPNAIKEHCVPVLMSQLPESLDPLAEICCVRPLVHTLTVRLLSRLDLTNKTASKEYILPIKILNTLVESTNHLTSSSEFLGFDRLLIPTLFQKFHEAAENHIQIDDILVDAACILVERAARGIPITNQQSYISSITKEIGYLNFHLILSGVAAMQEYPFESGFIQTYVLPHLQETSGILERAAYLRLIALVANKWPEQLYQDKSLEAYCQDLQSQIKNKDTRKPYILEAFSWLTKGLLLRADKLGFENATFLIESAPNDPQIGKIFGVLVADDRILDKANGCIVRPLFRQRLFVMSLKEFSDNRESVESLAALSNLLKYTPKSVLVSYFDQILPMLISSIESGSASVQAIALDTIDSSLPQCFEKVLQEVDRIIPRVLNIATSAHSAAARIAALKMLIALKSSSSTELARFNSEILDGVAPALGDPKREVRKYAVKCQQLFY